MELTTANAWKIYALGPSQLKPYLPRIFDRLKVPVDDGIWVETYVDQLGKKFAESVKVAGSLSGWDSVMKVCVEAGVFETMFSLVQHPRDDLETAVIHAIDCLHHLVTKANQAERSILLNHAVGCDALNVCLRILREHDLCIHRYSAGRMLRTLCSDLCYGTKLSAAATATAIESLCRHVLDDIHSYSRELIDPDKAWQAYRMTQHAVYTPEMASKYGLRWFGLTQELCMWSIHGMICLFPVPTKQHISDIVHSKPSILDLLLDIASVPRPPWYPETTVDQIATEILALMLQLPLTIIPGLEIPLDEKSKASITDDWNAVISVADLLLERPQWLPKILKTWRRLDKERLSELHELLFKVHSEWYGVEPDIDTMTSIYEYRGHMRVDILSIITTLTFADIDDVDLISLLRLTYEATKKAAPTSRDAEPTINTKEDVLYEKIEQTVSVFRVPMAVADIEEPGVTCDAVGQIAPQAVSAPVALLRLLTLLASHGVLDAAPTWAALPAGTADGTHLVHVRQILADDTLGRTLAVLVRRLAAQRAHGRESVREAPYTARAEYRQAAQLAAGLVAFDGATHGRWAPQLVGVRRELVLCLGNAAEMSNRVKDYGAAVVFASAALDVAGKAPRNEGITPDVVEKNVRRLELARASLERAP
ncbi:hypothetical protein PsYK624_014940 [Phanerochaete sordida]|uniref:Uncharacterized protein n=1 Tax=Phanerochaete sordida TaxID=48140 RepID=A0A9P3FZY5_9APHY|nr:hypothetical protein PsYK624_014940 [Phanerochaete sordida]